MNLKTFFRRLWDQHTGKIVLVAVFACLVAIFVFLYLGLMGLGESGVLSRPITDLTFGHLIGLVVLAWILFK